MEWIKTKDRLPENRQPILFSNGSIIQKGVFLSRYINRHTDAKNVFNGDDEGFYLMLEHTITHWMPLPDLPK